MSFASDFKSELSHLKSVIGDKHAPFEKKAENARAALVRLTNFLEKSYERNLFNLVDVVGTVFGHSASSNKNIRDAALKIARMVDNGADGTAGHAYHNRLHFSCVLVSAFTLAHLHNQGLERSKWLAADDVAQLMLAAVAHDIYHNGEGNKGVHFALEQKAIDEATRIAGGSVAGFDLIYATDVSGNPSPAALVRAAYDHYYSNGSMPTIPANMKAQLMPIVGDKTRTLLASLLMDADLLRSLLDEENSLKDRTRVDAEFKKQPSLKGSLFFLEKILGCRTTTHVADAMVGRNIRDMLLKFRAFAARGDEPVWPKVKMGAAP